MYNLKVCLFLIYIQCSVPSLATVTVTKPINISYKDTQGHGHTQDKVCFKDKEILFESYPDDSNQFRETDINMPKKLKEIRDNNPVEYYNLKLDFMYRFLARNQSCNYKEYSEVMPAFWTDFFKGTKSKISVELFAYRYWDVHVSFDGNESWKIVVGRCNGETDELFECNISREGQLKRERDICFSGALLECSEESGTCVCLQSHGTKTVRVDRETGKLDPEGNACFVEVESQCYTDHFGVNGITYPCAENAFCSSYTRRCHKALPYS